MCSRKHDLLRGSKNKAVLETDHQLPSITVIKNAWSYTPTSSLCCPINHMESFASTLSVYNFIHEISSLKLQRRNFFQIICKDPVRTSQETCYFSSTESNRLMLFMATVPVYCENRAEHTHKLCGQFVPHRKDIPPPQSPTG
jgi:hypothetical protein